MNLNQQQQQQQLAAAFPAVQEEPLLQQQQQSHLLSREGLEWMASARMKEIEVGAPLLPAAVAKDLLVSRLFPDPGAPLLLSRPRGPPGGPHMGAPHRACHLLHLRET